jgi:hypothetical protein
VFSVCLFSDYGLEGRVYRSACAWFGVCGQRIGHQPHPANHMCAVANQQAALSVHQHETLLFPVEQCVRASEEVPTGVGVMFCSERTFRIGPYRCRIYAMLRTFHQKRSLQV